MKNLLFVLCLCLSLTACNEDSTTEPGNPVKNVVLPSSDLTAGQPVTIKGEGFVASDQIWLKAVAAKATENTLIQATVTEATTTSIIFTVPTTAVGAFEILFQRGGGVKHSLGNLTFKALVKYYTFCYDDDRNELAEIDINTGNLTWTGLKIPEYEANGKGYVFDETTNELIAFNGSFSLSRLNMQTGVAVTLKVKQNGGGSFDNLIKINDKFYSFCFSYDKMELAEIDVNTGNVTWTGLKIPEYSSNGHGCVFDEARNELIAFDGFSLSRLNIKTGIATTIEVENRDGAGSFDKIIQINNKFYTFCFSYDKNELAEINIESGNLIWTGLKIPEYGSNGRGYVFDDTTNELVALTNGGETLSRLNMKTGVATTLDVKRNGGSNFDKIIRF